MKLRYPYEEERYRSLLDIDAAEEAAAEFTDSLLSADGRFSYWIDRRDHFFKNTTFALTDVSHTLLLFVAAASIHFFLSMKSDRPSSPTKMFPLAENEEIGWTGLRR